MQLPCTVVLTRAASHVFALFLRAQTETAAVTDRACLVLHTSAGLPSDPLRMNGTTQRAFFSQVPGDSSREPQLSIATSGTSLESHPIALSPMSRTESAVAPPTPHSPPTDEQPRLAAADESKDREDESGTIVDNGGRSQGPSASDAESAPAKESAGAGGGIAMATKDEHETSDEPAPEDRPAQIAPEAAAAGDAAAGLQLVEGGFDGDTESDPSTPVAVREALAAVHSLAISTGAVRMGAQQVDSLPPQVMSRRLQWHALTVARRGFQNKARACVRAGKANMRQQAGLKAES